MELTTPRELRARHEKANYCQFYMKIKQFEIVAIGLCALILGSPADRASAADVKSNASMTLPRLMSAEERAAAELKKSGLFCTLGRDIGESWWTNYEPVLSVKDKEALADHVVWCETPQKVGRETSQFNPAVLNQLLSLKHLRVLRLSHNSTTDKDLKNLAGLAELRELRLNDLPITDAGLAQLSGLKELRVLALAGNTNLTDAGLIHLSGLTNLQQLALFTVPVTGTGFVYLNSMSNLRDLGLGGTQVTDASLEHLSKLTTLTNLSLNNTLVTGAGLIYLKGLTNLECLVLSLNSDAGIEQIAGLGKLKRFSAGGLAITDIGLSRIAGMTNLENLDLFGTGITDTGLKSLAALKKLKMLFLQQNVITREAAAGLHEALPGCEITIRTGSDPRKTIRFPGESVSK